MRHEQPHARGFTLVELLVVVSIILLMVAIVVPGIRQATFNAKVVTCQAQMRNWGVSTIQYTADFNRYLPRQDINHDTSNNPWDISRDFFRVMIEGGETGVNSTGYGLPFNNIFCPLKPERGKVDYYDEQGLERVMLDKMRYANYVIMTGRGWWVPRQDTGITKSSNRPYHHPEMRGWVPYPPEATSQHVNFIPDNPEIDIAAPSRLSEGRKMNNPILTDLILSERDNTSKSGTHEYGKHRHGPKKGWDINHSTSLLYADGHTELKIIDVSESVLKIRHKGIHGGGGDQWRTWY